MTKYLNGHSDCPRRRRDPHAPGRRRENLFPAALHRRGPRAHGLLPGLARHQDAGRAHGAARRQRHGGRALSRIPSQGEARASIPACLPIPSTNLRAASSAASAAMLSFDLGTLDAARDPAQSRETVLAGRKPRRRRNPHLPSCHHDPRLHPRRTSASRSASPTASCASPWESRTSKTSSPTWIKPSPISRSFNNGPAAA